ncbi:hypothetical protein BYT27DRAFT_7114812, partial [Phlegmacium glaucopus]
KGSQKDGMATNIDLKGVGGPTTNGLDNMPRKTGFGERGGPTSTQRVTSDVGGEKRKKTMEKPGTGGDGTVVF